MKSGDRRYTIEWIHSGQPRPYADSLYEFTILCEWWPYKPKGEVIDWEPCDLTEGLVDQAAKALARNFYTKERNWASPFLQSRIKVSTGKWKYRISEAYTY